MRWSIRHAASARAPYHLTIGVAVGDQDASPTGFSRLSSPLIDRSPIYPLFCTAPFVKIENGHWRMWYVSGLSWEKTASGLTPSYNTRYAESGNGIDWHRTGLFALRPSADEFGFSRPSVLFDGQRYLMAFSVRG
jgi:hypothetical protein